MLKLTEADSHEHDGSVDGDGVIGPKFPSLGDDRVSPLQLPTSEGALSLSLSLFSSTNSQLATFFTSPDP